MSLLESIRLKKEQEQAKRKQENNENQQNNPIQGESVAEEQEGKIMSGGYFEFDDGGWYAGDWIDGQAYGYGKCTGPQGKGEYSGTWNAGFEVSGVYTWPNGHNYAGDWMKGKRNGLGVETKDKWVYKGEWFEGLKGRHGVKLNTGLPVKYEGSWLAGMQDGYGVETYIDESTYHGQWCKGMRHGFGVRRSALKGVSSNINSEQNALKSAISLPSNLFPRGKVISSSSQDAMYANSLENGRLDDTDRHRGGFVLVEKSKASMPRAFSLQRSRSFSLSKSLNKRLKLVDSGSISALQKLNSVQAETEGMARLSGSADIGKSSLRVCSVDVGLACAVETYAGEWKSDKRCGYGVSERSDGLKYEGAWVNDMRSGYGVTTYKNGLKEDGKYFENELVATLDQKRRLFSRKKFRDRLDASVIFARKAAQNSHQKAEIATSKRDVALAKARQADEMARKAHYLAEIARKHAKKFYIYYQDEISGLEVPVVEKPKSKQMPCESFSSWSDTYKTSFPVEASNDDVFFHSSKYHSKSPHTLPLHQATLPVPNEFPQSNSNPRESFSSKAVFQGNFSLQTTPTIKNKDKVFLRKHSLDRQGVNPDFKPLHQSTRYTQDTFMKHLPRKRLSTSERDCINASLKQQSDFLKPLANGSIPFIQNEFPRPSSSSQGLSCKSNQVTKSPTKAHKLLHNQSSYLDSPTCDRTQQARRRFSTMKQKNYLSYFPTHDQSTFQSIDMANYKSKLDKCSSSNVNHSSQDSTSDHLQQPSFRQKNFFSIDSNKDSVRPSPQAFDKSSSQFKTYEEPNPSTKTDINPPVSKAQVRNNAKFVTNSFLYKFSRRIGSKKI